ncbi:MAG TPA: class I SAM-dependent methyltransferase [Gammaproteobacteria bacterium]|nr:class I SAM-dependent methyltransferase [Gammaproteobacteria bacterium]
MRANSGRHFDKQYYDRFYGRNRPRRRELEDTRKLGDFVCAYLRYIGHPVRNVLDLGCGLGLWRDAIATHYPRATYRGVELSDYLCDEYGWVRGSVVDYRASHRFDLVICQDTVQYLPETKASAAIRNLGALARGVLYFSAPSSQDWKESVDPGVSDSNVYKRAAQWYRRRLNRSFRNLGGGVFLHRESEIVLWELEQL